MKKNSNIKILLIGKRSIVASNIYLELKKVFLIKQIKFKEFFEKDFSNFNIIINCSINKKYLNNKYNEKIDHDLKIVKKLNNNQSYIFLSTVKVYKESRKKISEKSKLQPSTHYGVNKMTTEKKIQNYISPNKLLILRISNMVCFEIEKKILKTFVHTMLNSLFYKKKIFLPTNKIYKDFITIKRFCLILKKIIFLKKLFGIYNLSSGFKYDLNLLARKLLEGYGKGNIIHKKNIKTDRFVISSQKLQKKLKIKIKYDEVLKNFYILGKRLKNYD